MHQTSKRHSPRLPPHVDRLDPRTIAWRVDQIEDRVDHLESQPHGFQHLERLPWERVILPLLLVIALKLEWISGDVVSTLLAR